MLLYMDICGVPWIPPSTKTPVMLAFFYQHQPDPSWDMVSPLGNHLEMVDVSHQTVRAHRRVKACGDSHIVYGVLHLPLLDLEPAKSRKLLNK